jgi:hypothetical protein
MNRFKKINDVWCIEIGGEPTVGTLVGQTVTVTLASGATKQVTLGAYLGNGIYANAPLASAPKVEIGSLDGIIALFDKAAARLKFPAVVLDVPGYEDGVRISRAGARAKFPGTLNVTNGAKDDSEYGRTWFGRVGLDGKYAPSRDATPEIAAALKAFAADPVKVATAYGRVKRSQIEVRNADGTVGFKLVGQCCFCRKALTDERSTDVGYGKICAGHYGLPWGATAVEAADDGAFHQEQAFSEEQRLEDEADRRLDWEAMAQQHG